MRDARRQPPERRQPCLLDAIVERGQVLEENQHRRRPPLAERREMRPDFPESIGGQQIAAGRVGVRRALAPHRQQVEEARRYLAQKRVRADLAAQYLARRFVDQPDAVLLVDDDQAFAQALDDVLREFGEICEVDIALAHQRLALAQAPRERRGRDRRNEYHGAQQSGLGEVRRIGDADDRQRELLTKHEECCDGRDHRLPCGSATGR